MWIWVFSILAEGAKMVQKKMPQQLVNSWFLVKLLPNNIHQASDFGFALSLYCMSEASRLCFLVLSARIAIRVITTTIAMLAICFLSGT
jgi:hypothetical protein